MVSPIKCRSTGPLGLAHLFLLTVLLCDGIPPASAADIPVPDGFDATWDNTLLYSTGIRIKPFDNLIVSNPNGDDGDRNFVPGLVSNRLDLRSIINVSKGDFGVEASIEAWYDTVYHTRTANNSPETYNAISVPNTEFPRAVRNLEGQYIDLTDTFAYANFTFDDVPTTVRIGRQTLLWGESLFFDENSIASAQAPVDYWKAITWANGYSNDVYLPVGQVSVNAQPRSDLAVAAYYQFEWRPSRLAGVGSYFSTTDVLGAGAERLLLGNGRFLLHASDQTPSHGEFGVSVHKSIGDVDLGVYALTYDSKYPMLTIVPYRAAPPGPGEVGKFYSAYPGGIQLYGASFSSYVGDSNLTGELVVRRNAPLANYASATTFPMIAMHWTGMQTYTEGDTLHAQLSSATTLSPSAAWDRADLNVEITGDFVFDVARSVPYVSQQRLAPGARALFEPHYFEVAPNLDITVPVGVGYARLSQYGTNYTSRPGGGDLEVGLTASYLSVWKANITIMCFLGSPYDQPLADRNFLSFSLERTF